MKQHIASLVREALTSLQQQDVLPAIDMDKIHIERTRDPSHGDFACNIAMMLAKEARCKPRDLAEKIVESLPLADAISKTDIAGPGFINFTLNQDAWFQVIDQIRGQGENYGRSNIGNDKKIIIEFVSANPTGPLHVGHGRGAAHGDSLARILRAVGYQTHSEYYFNDAGRQMNILALSVWLRYLSQQSIEIQFPSNCYQGDYILDISKDMYSEMQDVLVTSIDSLFDDLPEDPDQNIDELIARCQKLLGEEKFQQLFDFGSNALVSDIRQDLSEFGVEFQQWFSENSLVTSGAFQKAIETLEEKGHIYEKEGAKWFRSTDFGDEKDRVVMRSNGVHTYFATDLAYHFDKGQRADMLIDILGADHHGYFARIKASFEALGHSPNELEILMVQFAVLYRGGEKVSMSTRSGEFVTLRELRQEVGNDAARFFYALRKPDQHMDFDLDLAKSQSSENPVYYVQYAHARICRVFGQVEQKGMTTPANTTPDYALLSEDRELELMQTLSRYPEVVEAAAKTYEPHQLAYYLRDLATAFHGYYNAHPFLSSEDNLRLARLALVDATRQVIANGLDLLGVCAPEKM